MKTLIRCAKMHEKITSFFLLMPHFAYYVIGGKGGLQPPQPPPPPPPPPPPSASVYLPLPLTDTKNKITSEIKELNTTSDYQKQQTRHQRKPPQITEENGVYTRQAYKVTSRSVVIPISMLQVTNYSTIGLLK